MKVKLVVASGVHAGREVPIAGTQFMIGRDPQCQLRPASPAISKRHCELSIRGDRVFVKDFGSTNGTFINDEQIHGEVEVTNQARFKVGPLDFHIVIEPAVPPAKPVPVPVPARSGSGDDEIAAFLLEGDAGPTPAEGMPVVPDGSTIMELKAPDTEAAKKEAKSDSAKKQDGDTRSAAADILRQYQRRPRT